MITNNQNVIDIVQLPEISREEKQITILSNDEVIIDDFISFKMSTKGSIYQRNMKYCEVVLVGKHELTSEWINIKRFIASDLVDNGNLQEIDYGDFGVLKSEYDDTTQRTKLTCYDRMLQAQIPYDSEVMNLTYPMTISQVLNRLAIVCKLDLVVNTVNNLYQVIASDLWANQSFTYADVLDHIAQATTSIISIRDNKLEIFNPIENDFTIQGKFYSLKIGESYGKTNIVNVSQEPQHYNKFAPSNALDIPLEDRKELAFSNNPILNQDMQTWADRLYLQTKDLEYSTFESSTIGYGIFEIGDMVNVYEANEDIMHRVMITNETFDFKHALTTEIGSNMPMIHKNQYVVETDQVRQGQTTYLIVDQLNGVIEALVQKVDDEADKTAQLRIDVDSITSTVSNISNGNLLTNGSGELGFLGWSGGSVARYVTPKIRYMDGLTYSMGFIPQQNPQSLAEWEVSFYNNGFDVSPIAFIVPNIEHSYRAKVSKFKPFNIDVLEFDSSDKAIALTTDKVTNFAFNSPMDYVQFTFTPNATTQFVRFKYNRTGITTSDRLNIAEVMFNRGQPKEWQPSPNNAITYTRSNITQLANEIELKVDTDGVISAINLTSEQAKILANHISLEGLTTINGHFKVLENGDVEFNNAKGTNMDISGKVTATSGKIAGFDINGNNLVGETVSLTPRSLTIGGITLTNPEDIYVMEMRGGGLTIGSKLDDIAGRFIDFQDELGKHPFAVSLGHNIVLRASTLSAPSGATVKRIGEATNRYNDIFLVNQPNVSSDMRYKSDVQDIDPLLIEIIGREVKPKQYRTIYDDKLHFGYIAQDVERALYKYCGNDKDKYAVLHKDESYMSLLYGELNVIIEAYNRKRNDELEERIKALEERK